MTANLSDSNPVGAPWPAPATAAGCCAGRCCWTPPPPAPRGVLLAAGGAPRRPAGHPGGGAGARRFLSPYAGRPWLLVPALLSHPAVRVVVAGNLLWVAASVVAVVAGWWSPTGAGTGRSCPSRRPRSRSSPSSRSPASAGARSAVAQAGPGGPARPCVLAGLVAEEPHQLGGGVRRAGRCRSPAGLRRDQAQLELMDRPPLGHHLGRPGPGRRGGPSRAPRRPWRWPSRSRGRAAAGVDRRTVVSGAALEDDQRDGPAPGAGPPLAAPGAWPRRPRARRGRPMDQAGVDPGGRVQLRVGRGQHRRHGPAGRQPGHEDQPRVDPCGST